MTWVGLVLLAMAGALAYLAYVAVPVYYVHYEVRQVVRDFANRAVKDPDDAKLVLAMTEQLRRLGSEADPEAPSGERAVVEVSPSDVTWERSGTMLHVAFDYPRQITLPLVDRRVERELSVDLTLDIARAKWGGSP